MSKLYPGSHQIPAMRYHNKLSDAKVDAAMTNGEWCMQEKKDGCFYQLEKIDNDHIYLFSRTKSKKTGELAEKYDVEMPICKVTHNVLKGELEPEKAVKLLMSRSKKDELQ